jgi:hypothetical protein
MTSYEVVKMPFQELMFDSYKFSEFALVGTRTVKFRVNSVTGRDFNVADKLRIENMLKDLGKWENLIKTGLHLFSELGFIHAEEATLSNYEKPFGIGLYSTAANVDSDNENIWVDISLAPEERQRREAANITPIIQVEEIYGQLSNIPKWKTFEKTIKLLIEQR